MYSLLRWFFAMLIAVSCLPLGVWAQNGLTSGSLSGTVTDTTGAAIPRAQVVITSAENAVVRKTATDEQGSFVIRELPSGTFAATIAAPGFAAWRNGAVAVAVGRNTAIAVQLAPVRVAQQVTVQGRTEALDTTQTSPVANIDRDRIEELPIPSRNYLNFALLAPAVAAANPAFSQRRPGAEAGGFSAGGLRPSSNALYIDGSEDDDEYTGMSRTELSPEAISDFQIVNHGYAAQFGGSAGGAVDVEARAGSNLQHGDAFLFVQNGALNATPALEAASRKPDENRLRAGLSTGGAIRSQRLFYYIAGEQEMARGEEASDFSPQTAAPIDGALAGTGPLRGFRLQQGFFPTTNQETELSGRVDWNDAAHALMARYSLTNNRSVNDAFNTSDLFDWSARGSAFYDDNGINGSWSWTVSPRVMNQFNFEVAQRRVALRTGSTQAPGVEVAGIAQFGTPFDGNSRRVETHADFSDSVMAQHGKHLFAAGFAVSHIGLRAADREGFQGLYVFPDVSALAQAQPDFYIQSFGNPNTNFAEVRGAAWVQDHWAPRPGLALDYGLRYDINRLPGNLPQDADNLSPRVGFAWSPLRNWVARGGLGLYFDRYLLSTVNRMEEFNGQRAEQQEAEGAAAALYRSGAWFATPHAAIAPSIWQAQPSLANPYAETASFGVEHALRSQWTLSAEYRFVHGVRLGRTINSNLPPPVALTAANAAELGVTNPAPQQMGRLVFPLQRINPAYDAVNQFQTEAGSRYNGVTFTVNRQFTEEFELMAGYTLSKTIDDASSDTEQPQNPYAPRLESAPSLGDQRHRFVLSGLWVLGPDLDEPADRAKAAHPNALQKMIYGLEFAPILEAGSGFRDDPLTGADSNREHIYPFAARPLGEQRNTIQTPPQLHFDLRVLRMVPIWRGHLDVVGESFNLLNRQNVERLNTVYGTNVSAVPQFRTPVEESDARRVQFSLDYEY